MAKLSPKKKLFVKEYLKHFNAARAARDAGYSKKTARSQGQRLLTTVDIRRALAATMENFTSDDDIDKIFTELKMIAFGDIRNFIGIKDSSINIKNSDEWGDEGRTVSEISETVTQSGGSTKFKRYDKVKALELLGKYHKLFTDRVEHTGKDGGPIEVEAPLTPEERRELAGLEKKSLK